jgi:transcriptional regulator with XRE-family HTH domain
VPALVQDPLAALELGMHRHLVVSERLRLRRRRLGLTQKEVVARLRRIGVETTNKALSSLEHGAGLDVCKLPELSRALECTLTYLVGLTDDPARWEPDGPVWPAHEQTRVVSADALPGPATWEHDTGGRGPWILGPVPPRGDETG